ncbi:hypothetical protein UJ101_01389 [Flavobacteriaceae bacterium UJ101]|nr:hypothetical protein UJ101_01389 [Flavobacteriaceae bacterium UJ101]
MNFKERINLVERIDQLIRLKAIGTPEKLAERLDISKRQLHRIINSMKELDAPIVYNLSRGSYVYEEPVQFRFGFYGRELNLEEQQNINSGYQNISTFFNYFL